MNVRLKKIDVARGNSENMKAVQDRRRQRRQAHEKDRRENDAVEINRQIPMHLVAPRTA